MNAASIIPMIISGVSLLFVILTFARNGSKDSRDNTRNEDAKFEGIKESLLKVNLKLDQVCTTTNETRTDVKSLSKDMSDLDRRVTIIERDLKTVFTQVDELKKGDRHD